MSRKATALVFASLLLSCVSFATRAEIVGTGFTSTDTNETMTYESSKEIVGTGSPASEKEIVGTGKTQIDSVSGMETMLAASGLPWYKVFMLLGY